VTTSNARPPRASRIDFLFANGPALLFAALFVVTVWALEIGRF